jgi:hypothetical protein
MLDETVCEAEGHHSGIELDARGPQRLPQLKERHAQLHHLVLPPHRCKKDHFAPI